MPAAKLIDFLSKLVLIGAGSEFARSPVGEQKYRVDVVFVSFLECGKRIGPAARFDVLELLEQKYPAARKTSGYRGKACGIVTLLR